MRPTIVPMMFHVNSYLFYELTYRGLWKEEKVSAGGWFIDKKCVCDCSAVQCGDEE